MEKNRHFWWVNQLQVSIFDSYVKLPEGTYLIIYLKNSDVPYLSETIWNILKLPEGKDLNLQETMAAIVVYQRFAWGWPANGSLGLSEIFSEQLQLQWISIIIIHYPHI